MISKPIRDQPERLQRKVRNKMKSKVLQAGFAAFVLLSLLLTTSPSTFAAHCTMHKSAGSYGFTLSGVVISATGAVPIAAVGKAVLDSDGNASGSESRSVGGGFADETFTGKYTLNQDCTGSATLSFYESGQLVRTSVLLLVFDDHLQEIRMVQKSLQLPNGAFLPVVITVEARKVDDED